MYMLAFNHYFVGFPVRYPNSSYIHKTRTIWRIQNDDIRATNRSILDM